MDKEAAQDTEPLESHNENTGDEIDNSECYPEESENKNKLLDEHMSKVTLKFLITVASLHLNCVYEETFQIILSDFSYTKSF